MKIAYDHLIFSEQRYGGISRYITELAVKLDRQGENTKIFAPMHQNKYLDGLPGRLVTGRGFKGFPLRLSYLLKPLNNTLCNKQISDWNADVLHKSYFDWPRVRTADIPIVITLHDMIYELFSEMVGPFNDIIKRKKVAILSADHVICVSESTRRDAIEIMNISEDKISVVPLGATSFTTGKHSIKPLILTNRPYLLYVGKREGYKNFQGLLNAVGNTPRLMRDFDIVAFGGKSFTSQEHHEIARLDFSEGQVTQISGNDELLGEYYRNAEAFVFPSLYEGFGLPPLEAMSQKCPVISSNTSSMPEVIGSAAEFFNPNNHVEISQAIESVVYSASRRDELLVLGHERLKKFTWEKCAQRTLTVYKGLT